MKLKLIFYLFKCQQFILFFYQLIFIHFLTNHVMKKRSKFKKFATSQVNFILILQCTNVIKRVHKKKFVIVVTVLPKC